VPGKKAQYGQQCAYLVTDVVAESNLAVKKLAVGTVTAGDPLTYTILVTNTGPSHARAVTVTDEADVEFVEFVGFAHLRFALVHL